jgi:hypothetical protein
LSAILLKRFDNERCHHHITISVFIIECSGI